MKKHILKENYDRFFGKREFGDPLPTFKGVMEKHQINKLKEDWWDNMSPEDQAEYIKAHPTSQKAQASKEEPKEKPSDRYADVDTSWHDDPEAAAAQGSPGYTTSDDDNWGREKGYGQKGHKSYDSSDIRKKKDVKGREYDPKTGKGKGQDSRNEPDDEEYFKSMMGGDEDDYDMGVVPGSRELDDTPEDDSEKGSSLTSAPGRVPDEDDEDDKGGDDKPDSEEPEPEYSGDETYPDGDGPPDTSGAGEGSSQEELDDALEFQREYQSHLDKWAEEAAENDDDETLAKIQELDDENKKEQERLEQSGAKSMYRTGNELNQETLTIDGKQFRRISEGVEKQPKPKHAFSEFYQRFKK